MLMAVSSIGGHYTTGPYLTTRWPISIRGEPNVQSSRSTSHLTAKTTSRIVIEKTIEIASS